MLNIDEVSEFAKKRVIEILSEDVSKESIEMCAIGLAADKIARGDRNDPIQILRVVRNAKSSIAEYNSNRRAYGKLALQIYIRHIADEFTNEQSEHYLGPEL